MNTAVDIRTGRYTPPLPSSLTTPLWVCIGIGSLAFLAGILGLSPQRAWQAYLVNWLFWSGLSLSGLIIAALLQVTNARWAGPLRRIAECSAAFLPVSFLLFILVLLGRSYLFPWLQHPVEAKHAWLNAPFLFFRDIAGIGILYSIGCVFLYHTLRPEAERIPEHTSGWGSSLLTILRCKWRGAETEQANSQRLLTILSPVFLLLYAVLFSLLGFDLVMSLDPHWISTLFGAYFSIGNVYAGFAVVAIGAVVAHAKLDTPSLPTAQQSHDLGKIIFGFCILWAYLFWCQYLPIWYGNLPEETGFVLTRLAEQPWASLSFVVLVLNFLIPFPVLLSKRIKHIPTALASLGMLIVLGMWLERYVLVVPSLWPEASLPLGIMEVCILAGFFGAYGLAFLTCVRMFFREETDS